MHNLQLPSAAWQPDLPFWGQQATRDSMCKEPGTNGVLFLDSDPCGVDRGVVPLAPSTHHRGSTYKLCAQPITLRLGCVVLERARIGCENVLNTTHGTVRKMNWARQTNWNLWSLYVR